MSQLEADRLSCVKGTEALKTLCAERDACSDPTLQAKLVKKADKAKAKLTKSYELHKARHEAAHALQTKLHSEVIPPYITELEGIEKNRVSQLSLRMKDYAAIMQKYQDDMAALANKLSVFDSQPLRQIQDGTKALKGEWGEPVHPNMCTYGLACSADDIAVRVQAPQTIAPTCSL